MFCPLSTVIAGSNSWALEVASRAVTAAQVVPRSVEVLMDMSASGHAEPGMTITFALQRVQTTNVVCPVVLSARLAWVGMVLTFSPALPMSCPANPKVRPTVKGLASVTTAMGDPQVGATGAPLGVHFTSLIATFGMPVEGL